MSRRDAIKFNKDATLLQLFLATTFDRHLEGYQQICTYI